MKKPLSISSKFSICGLPLRGDTEGYCKFNCLYCFANNRKIMPVSSQREIDFPWLIKKLEKKSFKSTNFFEVCLREKLTWHIGAMSDPFQDYEAKNAFILQDIAKKYGYKILFSSKGFINTEKIDINVSSIQLSVSTVRGEFDGLASSMKERIETFNILKQKGCKVGIRIQPFIPEKTTIELLNLFPNADHYTIEGIKLVPQVNNKELLEKLGLDESIFTQRGLLTLAPSLRTEYYEEFIKEFKEKKYSYSIADNDMRYLSNNLCCCGDKLVGKTLGIDTTFLELTGCNNYKKYCDCSIKGVFSSNRNMGIDTIGDYFEKSEKRNSLQYDNKQIRLF